MTMPRMVALGIFVFMLAANRMQCEASSLNERGDKLPNARYRRPAAMRIGNGALAKCFWPKLHAMFASTTKSCTAEEIYQSCGALKMSVGYCRAIIK